MKDTVAVTRASASTGWLDAFARRVILRSLSKMSHGAMTLVEDGERQVFGDGADGLAAKITVHSPRAYRLIAFGGTVGAGRAYIEGLWSTNDLPALVRIFIRNQDALMDLESGTALAMRQAARIFHALRRNSRRGSKRNIAEHYDLGNDFYRLFLDETMAYSCGVFSSPGMSMKDASTEKFDRICRKLELSPSDRVIEIGTGWGGFALHAAKTYGCHVTSTTISEEQYRHARERVEAEGLGDRIEVVNRDYRDLTGQYDKLVSIEMIEAVGYEFFDTFFATCARLLKPNGVLAIQAITSIDQKFDRLRREVDFIQHYVFPGSCLPSITALTESATRASDLRLFHLEDLTRHYVTTLQEWRRSFWSKIDRVREQQFSESFIRLWDFYLSYCEAGFAERYIGNAQLVMVKPGWRPANAAS